MDIIDRIKDKNIAFFCFDRFTKEMIPVFEKLGCHIDCIIDNNEALCGRKYKKIPIVLPQMAIKEKRDLIFIVLNEKHRKSIKSQLIGLEVREEDIIDLGWTDIWTLKSLYPQKWIVKNMDYYYDVPIEKSITNYYKIIIKHINNYHLNCNNSYKTTEKKYFLSICAIFKNEGRYIKEWLDYHIIAGIDHFYMYNNNSIDDFEVILKPYVKKNIVTLIEWPFMQSQMDAYRDCIKKHSQESNWIGFIDLDEFVVPGINDNLKPYFRSMMKYGSVWIPWVVYGSGGLVKRDNKRFVIEDFVIRWDRYDTVGKCFWNTFYNFDDSKMVFHHDLWTSQGGNHIPPVDVYGRYCIIGYPRKIKKHIPIYINHYAIKSLEEYKNKMSGSDVFFEDNPHNLKAFYWHDDKCNKRDISMKKWIDMLKELKDI